MSAEDRADEGVRLTEDELRRIVRHMSPMAPGHALVELQHDVERILAARLAEVEQERDECLRAGEEWQRDAYAAEAEVAREKARADALAEQVAEVARLHADAGDGWCSECSVSPCRTRAALDRARGLDGAS